MRIGRPWTDFPMEVHTGSVDAGDGVADTVDMAGDGDVIGVIAEGGLGGALVTPPQPVTQRSVTIAARPPTARLSRTVEPAT
jgi:hypothetical protein